jgi:adenosine deaminase
MSSAWFTLDYTVASLEIKEVRLLGYAAIAIAALLLLAVQVPTLLSQEIRMPAIAPQSWTRKIPEIPALPKAELHIRLEGAARWSTIRWMLYQHNGIRLPELPSLYHPEFRFADFAEFKDRFRRYIHPWLRTSSGYAELINDVVDALIEQRIRYVELNCNLPYVEQFGASLEKVLQLLESAVERAQEQGTIIRIIAGISRDRGAEYVSYWVRRFLKYGIISGFDLHGLEVGWSANLFKEAFAPAREAGKKIKVHAGEMVGAESIRIAVEELGVNQIGHGTSAIADPTVVDLLVSRNVVVGHCLIWL